MTPDDGWKLSISSISKDEYDAITEKIDPYHYSNEDPYHIRKTSDEILDSVKVKILQKKLKEMDHAQAKNPVPPPEVMIETIIEAMEAGETPEWLILKGDPAKKNAAEYWVSIRKKIAARKAREKEEEIRKEKIAAARAKLSPEEKKLLGLPADVE